MNKINPHARSDELAAKAYEIGGALPAYPEQDQIKVVVNELVKLTHCTNNAAHAAVVVGILRPKRKALK